MIGPAFWRTCQKPKYGVSFGWAFTISTSYTAKNSKGGQLSTGCALALGLKFGVVRALRLLEGTAFNSAGSRTGRGLCISPGGGSAEDRSPVRRVSPLSASLAPS